jgi:16S rRNA processing protein RimM
MARPEVVAVGRIGKPVGLRGDVHVHPDPDLEHDFPPGTTYDAGERTLTATATRVHAGRRVVRFAEASSREQAEALRGTVLRLPASAVPLPDDAHWAADVVGREVRDPEGNLLGVVEQILDAPAHDYLVVARPDGGDVLVPAVEELVDVDGAHVVVRAIPGLFDDGADAG